jgi:hypothetical protein
MNIVQPILPEEVNFNQNIELAIWSLLALRNNMKGQFRGFDDSILNLCLDILFREFHLQSSADDCNFHCELDALILKYSASSSAL